MGMVAEAHAQIRPASVMLTSRLRTISLAAFIYCLRQPRGVRFERRFPHPARQCQERASQRSAKYRDLHARRERLRYQHPANRRAQMRRLVKRHDRSPNRYRGRVNKSVNGFNVGFNLYPGRRLVDRLGRAHTGVFKGNIAPEVSIIER
jgi:hypothetical protein